VSLLQPLAKDLAEWKLASSYSKPTDLVFPDPEGRPWRLHTYKNWVRRVFKPLVAQIGFPETRPYDLRHSFASLLLQTLQDNYWHIIEELRGSGPVNAEALIRKARQRPGHILVTQDSAKATADEKKGP
jgi:integrase